MRRIITSALHFVLVHLSIPLGSRNRPSSPISSSIRVHAVQPLLSRSRLSDSSGLLLDGGSQRAASLIGRAERRMASSVLGGRGSPARRLSSANGNHSGGSFSSSGPRDRLSRFLFFSILLVGYSGVTLALILWNNSGGNSSSSTSSGGGGGAGPPAQVLRGGDPPARPSKGEPAAGGVGGALGATSTQGMPKVGGGDGGLVGDGSGATEDTLTVADDTEGGGEGAGKPGSRGGDGLGVELPSGQVRRRSFTSCLSEHGSMVPARAAKKEARSEQLAAVTTPVTFSIVPLQQCWAPSHPFPGTAVLAWSGILHPASTFSG